MFNLQSLVFEKNSDIEVAIKLDGISADENFSLDDVKIYYCKRNDLSNKTEATDANKNQYGDYVLVDGFSIDDTGYFYVLAETSDGKHKGLVHISVDTKEDVSAEIATVNSNVLVVKDNVEDLSTNVDALNTKATDIKSVVDGIDSDVDDIKSDVGSIKTDVTTLKTDVNLIKNVECGNWEIKDSQLIVTDYDGNEIIRFNLYDLAGNPTSYEVFKRVKA